MGKRPVVSKCKVSRTMFGSWQVEFECPSCRNPLVTNENSIGQIEDCEVCGAEFLIHSNVREQLEAIESEKESRQQEAAERKRAAEQVRRQEKRQTEIARSQAESQRKSQLVQHEYERGFDYPNLRNYQSSIEMTAIFGALLFCLPGILSLGYCIYLQNVQMIAAGFLIAMICFASAASWYFFWMVLAEMIRLTITVALDVRAIRESTRDPAEDDSLEGI